MAIDLWKTPDIVSSITYADLPRGPDSASSTSGFVWNVYADNVDAHFAHAKSRSATIVCAPENGFWGGRICRVRVHEGHRWEISRRGRDLAKTLWALPPGVTRGVKP